MKLFVERFVYWALASLLAILLALVPSTSANAQTLAPSLDGSNPIPSENSVPREQGRKGLLFKYCYVGADGKSNCFPSPNNSTVGFPLDMTSATVSLTIGTNPLPTCTSGINPAPNTCSYTVVDGEDGDGVLNTVKILYNGDFPDTSSIKYSVTGAKSESATGVVQSTDPNEISFTTGSAIPRPPVSLESVVDISGSMDWSAVPSGAVKRIDALKQASQFFFKTLKAHARLGDKIGTVYFSTTSTPFDRSPGGTNLKPAHDPEKVKSNEDNVQLQVPTNATSIGAGLLEANTSGFVADTNAASNTKKAVVLFSDGEQNTDPLVSTVGANLQIGTTAFPSDIIVCPITLGQQTAPGFILMQSIANLKCKFGTDEEGRNAHILDSNQTFVAGELETFFGNLLSILLQGDKLEVVADSTGEIAKNQVVEFPFIASKKDNSISVLVSWQSDTLPGEEPLTFQLVAPNSTPVNLTSFIQTGQNMSLATLPFPLQQTGTRINPEGTWKVRLLGKRLISPKVRYHVMILSDNTTLASSFQANIQDPGTGEAIPLIVELRDQGKPILGAKVTAKVTGPAEGIGDILSRIATSSGQLNQNGEKLSDSQKKLLMLLNDPAYAGLFKSNTVSILLEDNGQNGDAKANDGIYGALFKGTLEEGHYNFSFDVNGQSLLNNNFQRSQKFSVFVRPKPYDVTTVLQQSTGLLTFDGQVPVTLKTVLKDSLGNNLGPGYESLLQLKLGQGKILSQLRDNLDGSYQVSYLLPQKLHNTSASLKFIETWRGSKISQILSRSLAKLDYKPPKSIPLEELFKAYDRNIDGYISREEWPEPLRQSDFDRLDRNLDGYLTLEEIHSVI